MSDDLLRYSMAFLLFLSSFVHCSMILLFGLLLRRFEWMLLFIFLVLIIFKILLFSPLHFLMLVWYNIPKHILQNLCGWWAICILGSTRLSKTIGVIHFVSMLLLPINQFKSRKRMKTIFTMLYSPAGGTMHLCASAVHRDKEESLWQCDHKIVTNQLQQEQFLQIATTKILFSGCYFQTKRICSRFTMQ